jgi:two-component system alkaline phosphatase synthesis response regulator PhoP
MTGRILLAEDEASLREMIALNLEMEGYTVVSVSDGRAAIKKANSERFDLIVLDVMLPELDGFSVCEQIRLENEQVPVMFLTAKHTSSDRVHGLKLGADDYLTKPFDLEEFILRVNALVRRGIDRQARTVEQPKILQFGNNSVNFNSFEIETYKGEKNVLTKREIQLLKLLFDKKGEVVSRQLILERVWGYDVYPSTRTIDNFILVFRKYFEENPKEPVFFHSIRGVGYRFTPDEN